MSTTGDFRKEKGVLGIAIGPYLRKEKISREIEIISTTVSSFILMLVQTAKAHNIIDM